MVKFYAWLIFYGRVTWFYNFLSQIACTMLGRTPKLLVFDSQKPVTKRDHVSFLYDSFLTGQCDELNMHVELPRLSFHSQSGNNSKYYVCK